MYIKEENILDYFRLFSYIRNVHSRLNFKTNSHCFSIKNICNNILSVLDKYSGINGISDIKGEFSENISKLLACAKSICSYYDNGIQISKKPIQNYIIFVYLMTSNNLNEQGKEFVKLIYTYIDTCNNLINSESLNAVLKKCTVLNKLTPKEHINILANISFLNQLTYIFKLIVAAIKSTSPRGKYLYKTLINKRMGLLAINYIMRSIDISQYADLKKLLKNISDKNLKWWMDVY